MDVSDNVVGLVAVIMVFSIVLIPMLGLTARYALKPTMEAFSGLMNSKTAEENVHLLERRLELVEMQIESIERTVRRLESMEEFDRRLEGGSAPERIAEGDPRPGG